MCFIRAGCEQNHVSVIKKRLSRWPLGPVESKACQWLYPFHWAVGLSCCLDPTIPLRTNYVWRRTGSCIPNDASLGHPMVTERLLTKLPEEVLLFTRLIFEMTCCLKSNFKSIQICQQLVFCFIVHQSLSIVFL